MLSTVFLLHVRDACLWRLRALRSVGETTEFRLLSFTKEIIPSGAVITPDYPIYN